MAITAAELMVRVGADTSQAEAELQGFGGKVKSIMGGLAMGAVAGVGAAAAGLGALVISGMGDAREAIAISKQTAAVIKSTGGAAGMTAQSVADLATSLSGVTNFEDDAIQAGENMLLTFTNIGSDVFPSVTETALDMSTALGQDMKSSAMQLGKALNDPAKGLTALQRVGVSFTKQQEDQIKAMAEAGNVAGAQKVILAELAKEFGGSAKAAADPITQLTNAWGNFKEATATAVIPALNRLAQTALPYVSKAMAKVTQASSTFFEYLDSGAVTALGAFKMTMYDVFGNNAIVNGIVGTVEVFDDLRRGIMSIFGADTVFEDDPAWLRMMDTAGDAARNFGRYMMGIVTDGDYLNAWLTHLPEPLQGIAQAFGTAVAPIADFGRSVYEAFQNLQTAVSAVWMTQTGDIFGAVSAYLTLPENWQTKVDQVNAAIDSVQALGRNLKNAFSFFVGMQTGDMTKAITAFQALPKEWQSMADTINVAAVTPIVGAINTLVSGAAGLATIPTFIAAFQGGNIIGALAVWETIPAKLKPIANALNTFVTSVKAFAAIAGGVGVLPAMTLTIKSADAEGAGRKAGASFREGIEAALNADGGIFGGGGAGFMGGGAIASFSMAGAEAGKAFREEIQAKGFEPAMADLNAQIASSEIGKLNTAITDYVSNWFAGFEAELITMEPPGWVTDINTWWESVKSYEPGWVTTLNAWQEKVSAMFGGGITVPEDVTHPKIQDTRGAGGWWDDLVPTLKGLLQFGGPIIGAKMPNVTAQITQLDTGGLPQSGGAPAIDVNALVGAIQLDPVAAQDFANVTLPKLPFALGGYAGITGPLQAPSAEELTLKVPELPKWEWPELPKWVWPTLPRWEWPSIPAPGWLSQLGVDRPGWLGELIAWHPVVTVVPGTVPANASGVRNFGGGLSWVGERGPELVYLPRGANVYSNEESRGMVGAATVNIYANGYSATDARRLALDVAKILGRRA